MAAVLVSGSRDPLTGVLASAPAATDSGDTTTSVGTAPPAVAADLPWAHARAAHTPASTSRRTPDTTLVNATDIPLVALAAYQRAAAVIDAADPSCRLDWSLLAAIGRIESDHGRFGGSSLGADGVDRPGVVGPQLDGTHGTSVVRDTDAGRLDGDPRYDRAVGPMQFLPSTWALVAVDGDGDGRRDPQDINDAALGSAVYLCSSHDDLSTRAGQQHALLRYNHSLAYVADVMAIARAYGAGSLFLGATTAPVGTLIQAVRTGSPGTDTTTHQGHHPRPGSDPSSQPSTGPGGTHHPSDGPTDNPSGTPTDSPSGPTGEPTDGPTAPTGQPTDGPTDTPTDDPSAPTGQPTDGPTDTPTDDPGGPTGQPTDDPPPPTGQPTEPPILPDPLPVELVGLTADEVTAIDTAWPVCRDSLPDGWTADDLLACLSAETGIPTDDADLLAAVDWIFRLEHETTP